MTEEKYVVATECYWRIPRPGLGWMLAGLAVSWRYALETGRTLVIDWRDTLYLSDSRRNLFAELFETDGKLGAVTVKYAGLDAVLLPEPYLVAAPENAFLQECLSAWNDVDQPTVFFGDWLPLEDFYNTSSYARMFHDLKVKQPYRRIIEQFKQENYAGRTMLGLHVRHGNGELEDYPRVGKICESSEQFIAALRAAIARYKTADAGVFLSTDSTAVVDALKSSTRGLITRTQWRPELNRGNSLHLAADSPDDEAVNAGNALIDMYLLAATDTVLLAMMGNQYRSNFANLAWQLAKGTGKTFKEMRSVWIEDELVLRFHTPGASMSVSMIPARVKWARFMELHGNFYVSLAERPQGFVLNDSLALILGLCNGKRTVAGIIEHIGDCYGPSNEIQRDVLSGIDMLTIRGIVMLFSNDDISLAETSAL